MSTILQNNEEKKDEESQQGAENLTQNTNQSPQASTSAAPSSPRPKGSGRFTNVQKYLNANKSGGSSIAGGIGRNLSKGIDTAQEKAQDYYSKLNQGITQAKDANLRGQQYNEQLNQINQNITNATGGENFENRANSLGIQDFRNNPNFSDFQNFQKGNLVNERQLGLQQQGLTQSSGRALDASTSALDQLSNPNSRFNLLKKTFGGNANPQYTVGQQRLDSLFLNDQSLNPLTQNFKQRANTAQGLLDSSRQTGQDVGQVTEQESALLNSIADVNQRNEQGYVDMLGSYIPKLNELRGQEYQQLQNSLAQYRPGANLGNQQDQKGLTAEQMTRLGLDPTKQYGTYNVLRDLGDARDVAIRGADAQNYRDVANTTDVARYNALADIARLNDSNRRITQESQIGDAFRAQEGQKALANRFQAADDQFKKYLDTTTIKGGASGLVSTNDFSSPRSIIGERFLDKESGYNIGNDESRRGFVKDQGYKTNAYNKYNLGDNSQLTHEENVGRNLGRFNTSTINSTLASDLFNNVNPNINLKETFGSYTVPEIEKQYARQEAARQMQEAYKRFIADTGFRNTIGGANPSNSLYGSRNTVAENMAAGIVPDGSRQVTPKLGQGTPNDTSDLAEQIKKSKG